MQLFLGAGLRRMGWSDDIVTTYLDKDILLPLLDKVH